MRGDAFGRLYCPNSSVDFQGTPIEKVLTGIKHLPVNFRQGNLYFWLNSCMNNIYIKHISVYAKPSSNWLLSNMLINQFWVTSWFDSVCVQVTSWLNFRQKCFHQHEQQLSEFNAWKYFHPTICISGRKVIFAIFASKHFHGRFTYYLLQPLWHISTDWVPISSS